MVQTVYQGEDRNIPLILDLASSFIQENNFRWDGYLIINKMDEGPALRAYELMIPVSKDYYNIFIKPYGITRIVITFLCLLFAVFLFSYKKGRIKSNRILGIFMLCYILLNLSAFQWIYNIYREWPHLYNFAISINFLTGPLLFFYSLSVVDEKFRFKKIHALHLLPFMAVAMVYLFLYQVYDAETKIDLLTRGFHESLFVTLIYIGGRIQYASYLLLSLYLYFASTRRLMFSILILKNTCCIL